MSSANDVEEIVKPYYWDLGDMCLFGKRAWKLRIAIFMTKILSAPIDCSSKSLHGRNQTH